MNESFDPAGSWDSPSQAIEACSKQPNPLEAAKAVILANIDMGEHGFASEVAADLEMLTDGDPEEVLKGDKDASDFLATLLFAQPEDDEGNVDHHNKTIYDFSPAFIRSVSEFCKGFRDYMALHYPDVDIEEGERSVGGNVYFGLTGHGCGFWDDKDGAWGKLMQEGLVAYSNGNAYRFDHIDLMEDKHGKLDLSVMEEYIDERRAIIFDVSRPRERTMSEIVNGFYECDDCGHTALRDKLPYATELPIRMTPGFLYTDKECPKCGCLCYPVDHEPEEPAKRTSEPYNQNMAKAMQPPQ